MRQLRSTILTIPASKIGIQPSKSYPKVFAVLMDWNLAEHMATVVSDLTGFASYCTPSTYEILGGPHHESGRAAATSFVRTANRHYDEAVPTKDYPYPEAGRVRIYLLCFDGVRAIDADAAALANGTDKCSDLWAEAQRALTELHLVTESAGKTP
jgi:hypothetical protein